MTLVLLPAAVALVAVGAGLAWPVARRWGERHPVGIVWEPVDMPAGRRWRPVQYDAPRPRRTLADWWASTAPRDVHAAVRRAMAGPGRRPFWMDKQLWPVGR